MTEKVTLRQEENLPMPLIYLATAEDLAEWYTSQLEWSLEQGELSLAISCFDTAPMGFPLRQAARCVLKAVMAFLYAHPEAEHLTVRCAGRAVFDAYSLHWNMWYAAHKPHRED